MKKFCNSPKGWVVVVGMVFSVGAAVPALAEPSSNDLPRNPWKLEKMYEVLFQRTVVLSPQSKYTKLSSKIKTSRGTEVSCRFDHSVAGSPRVIRSGRLFMIQHVGWGSGYNFHFKLHDQLDLVCIVFDPNKEYSDEDGNSYRGAYTDSIETRDFVESVAGTLGFRLPPISDPVEFPSQRRFRRR